MNDSWDDPESKGFFGGLTGRWRAWRDYRRMMAEERREIRRIESGARDGHEGFETDFGVSEKSKARSYESRAESDDENEVVTRVRKLPEASSADFDDRPEARGLMAQWRQAAEMRRNVREERRAIEKELQAGESGPSRAAGSEDEFGVGASRLGVQDQDESQKFSLRNFIAAIWFDLVRLRLPQWAVATVPALIMLFGIVVPALSESDTRSSANLRSYAEKWPGLIAGDSWKEAELCGARLITSDSFGVDDAFRYFESLANLGDMNRAVRYLISRETTIRSSDLARYRFRLAEKLSTLPSLSARPAIRNLIFTKVRESLSGPLPEADELKARQLLANNAIARGDFPTAIELLEPLSNRSPLFGADLQFLKFNIASEEDLVRIRSAASTFLVAIDTRMANQEPDLQTIQSRLRLLMILDREKEARSWFESLTHLNAVQRKAMGLELEKISLLTEGRKRPANVETLWARLKPLLESEPNNKAWNRLALGLWASSPPSPDSPMDRWVREKLKAPSIDPDFLREGCLAAHLNARWDDSRIFYHKLLEQDPNDVSALNNLSGMMYKFPPRDLNESLRLVDRALELAPKNLVILETRGQVLARLGRFSEARDVLVRTLPALPKEWNLHNTLAQIYDREGDTRNAQAHRDILKSITKPRDAERYENLADFVERPTTGPAPANGR